MPIILVRSVLKPREVAVVREPVRKKLRIIATIAFWVAAVVGWWTVIEDGPSVMNTLPAACVTLAGVIWLVMVVSPKDNLR
jgi:hypothetical protein